MLHILAIGDVVGDSGVQFLRRHLHSVIQWKKIDFVVVNGENASGTGLTPQQAKEILAAGADVITLGNHSFARPQIAEFLEESPYILRPANYTGAAPGRGCGIYEAGRCTVRVINLLGRCDLDFNADNPFTTVDRLLKQDTAQITLVDFHAEATSEKLAMAFYLDGRVAALWGTHTHVPTADEQVFPQGTGYITDVGMTGPIHSVLGIRPEQSVTKFLGGLPGRYQTAEGDCKMQGALFHIDETSSRCTQVERLDIR